MRRVIAALILAVAPSASHAVATDCITARSAFGQTRDRVGQMLRPYAECIRASDGDALCREEFEHVQRAQRSLENAGNAVQVNCSPE